MPFVAPYAHQVRSVMIGDSILGVVEDCSQICRQEETAPRHENRCVDRNMERKCAVMEKKMACGAEENGTCDKKSMGIQYH